MVSAHLDTAPVDASRRSFLKGTAALTFVVGTGGLVSVASAGAEKIGSDPLAPNIWVTVEPDNTVAIVFPITEMGQGSSSALPLILAEEMDADWDRIRVDQLNRDDRDFGNPVFGNVLYTAGSTGVYGYFDPLRRAGAQARLMLMAIAARALDVPAAELETEPGFVVHRSSGRRLTYGEIAGLPRDGIAIPDVTDADLKPREAYRLIGKDVPRRDISARTDGSQVYTFDVQVPGMLHASVLRAPVEGETPAAIDDTAARSMPGVRDIVTLPDGVAVIAERPETALAARQVLDVTWTETAPARAFDSEASLAAYEAAATDLKQPGAVWRAEGDAAAAIEAGAKVVSATYLSDYAYHAQLEPMAAVASVDADGKGAEVWAGTQTQSWTMRTITEVLGTTPDRVRLTMVPMGGSFGRRTALTQEYVRDALLASKAVGAPVRVLWSREDDLKHGWFRPAAAQHMRAGLTAENGLSGWHHRVASPSVIAYFNPVRWSQVEPQDIIAMRGSESGFYGLPDMRAEHLITERGARIAPWRGIGAAYTSFAAEAFMDELAEAAGRDPIDFRMDLLADNPRGRRLLEKVAERAGWGRAPSEGRALGVAFAGYGASMAAGIAEIGLTEDGMIRVHRFTAAVDAGLIVAPDNARAQIEGGIVFGVSSALKERVTIRNGEVEQSNFYDYEILRANEVPEIVLDLEPTDGPPTAIGEVGTPMVAPAIANAFHALTGARLRHMPFTPDRVAAARA